MRWFRNAKFAAVCARTCTWTHDLRILMPTHAGPLEGLVTPLPLLIHTGTLRETVLGLVEHVEVCKKEVLCYGQLIRGAQQDWHAIEMYLGREYIVPLVDYLDVEERPDGRQMVWDWAVRGFEVTRYPPWDDLPAPRVQQSRPSW